MEADADAGGLSVVDIIFCVCDGLLEFGFPFAKMFAYF